MTNDKTPNETAADAVRVEQMLWNLVRNALKFTPRGGRIGIKLSRDDDFICIEVALTGFGRAQDAKRALRAGFNAHLAKPVSLPVLLSAIDRIKASKLA